MKITLTINKKKKNFDIPTNHTLMELLRGQGNWSVKHGCETRDCGNCAVIVDGLIVNSCIMLAAQANGKSVLTFEGLTFPEGADPIKECLMDFGDIDCGYCIPAMLLSIKALTDKIPDPTNEEILDALGGHVCRCTQSPKPLQALLRTIKKWGRG